MAGPVGASCVRGKGKPVDILLNAHTNSKAKKLLEALQRGGVAAGLDARLLDNNQIRQDSWLFLYGLGGSDRIQYANRPKLAAFDLAYWDRKGDGRKFRVSIGGLHCPGLIFSGSNPGPARFGDRPIIEHGGNPGGPILLIGNGPKSAAIGAAGWCAEKSRELRNAFPGRKIWYRPKPGRHAEVGVDCDRIDLDDHIDSVLAKVSLVVCRHSNVAVDACRAGVPVVCDDGAAASIYPRHWDFAQPSLEQRTEFLHRLAWWQWSPAECETALFWNWFRERMQQK